MEITHDVSNHFPSLYASQSDSSMFRCQKENGREQQQQHDEIITIVDQKYAKKTVSFPFGKW